MENNLKEYIGDHLKEWNTLESDLWLKLVALRKVERENTETFIKFSKWFDQFFLSNNRYPTLREVLREFTGDIK